MNRLLKYSILILSFAVHAQVDAEFFYKEENERRIVYCTHDELFDAQDQNIRPDTIYITSDLESNPPRERLALITQKPGHKKEWKVQYITIKRTEEEICPNLKEAQDFALLYLYSGDHQKDDEIIPSARKNEKEKTIQPTRVRTPHKAVIPDRSKRGDWRRVRSQTR